VTVLALSLLYGITCAVFIQTGLAKVAEPGRLAQVLTASNSYRRLGRPVVSRLLGGSEIALGIALVLSDPTRAAGRATSVAALVYVVAVTPVGVHLLRTVGECGCAAAAAPAVTALAALLLRNAVIVAAVVASMAFGLERWIVAALVALLGLLIFSESLTLVRKLGLAVNSLSVALENCVPTKVLQPTYYDSHTLRRIAYSEKRRGETQT